MKFSSAYLRSVVLPLALLPLGYSITNTRTATTLYRGQELNSHGKIKIHAHFEFGKKFVSHKKGYTAYIPISQALKKPVMPIIPPNKTTEEKNYEMFTIEKAYQVPEFFSCHTL